MYGLELGHSVRHIGAGHIVLPGAQLVLLICSKRTFLANIVSKMLATLHVGRDTEENKQRPQRKDDKKHSGGPTLQH